jgi:uncharacterized membrane protein HdeD (DUF308 family)
LAETFSNRDLFFRGRGWAVILRGLIAVAFGILAFAWPGMTLPRLAFLFGLYAILHGILSIAAAIGSRGNPGCGLLATEGIVGIFAGIMTFQSRSPSPKALVFLVWLWAIATGILRIAEAIRMRKHILGDVWLMLSGLVAVFLGGMLLLRPFIGVLGLASMIAVFALLWGIFEVILGWEQRVGRHHGRTVTGT